MKATIARYFSCLAVVLTLSLLGFGQSSSSQSTSGQDQGSTSGSASGATTSGKKHKASKSSDMSSSSSSATGAQISSADKTFITKAAEGGLAEVELGQLAKDKAQDPKVKEFGDRMVTDHTKANDELKSLASQKGVTLPTEVSAKDKAEKDRLSKLSGDQFDRAYMKYMVQDHTKDVSEFQKESRSAKDSDVKSFASNTLPTLQDHLKMAKSINPGGASAGSSSAKSSDTSANRTSSVKSKKGSSTSASNPPQL